MGFRDGVEFTGPIILFLTECQNSLYGIVAQEYLNHLCDGELITYKEADSDITQQLLLESSLHIHPFCQIFIRHFLWANTWSGALGDGKMKKSNTYSANSTTA